MDVVRLADADPAVRERVRREGCRMDRLRERLTVAARAVETPRELALPSGPTRTERDAASQRFEYSLEATWKEGQ